MSTPYDSIEGLPLLLEIAKGIEIGERSDVDELAQVFVTGVLAVLGHREDLCGQSIEQVQWEVANVLAGTDITDKQVRTIVRCCSEDIILEENIFSGSIREKFFYWFKEEYKTYYQVWLERKLKDIVTANPDFDPDFTDETVRLLILQFSNDFFKEFLYGIIEAYQQEEILVSFCEKHPKAKRQIHLALKQMETLADQPSNPVSPSESPPR